MLGVSVWGMKELNGKDRYSLKCVCVITHEINDSEVVDRH